MGGCLSFDIKKMASIHNKLIILLPLCLILNLIYVGLPTGLEVLNLSNYSQPDFTTTIFSYINVFNVFDCTAVSGISNFAALPILFSLKPILNKKNDKLTSGVSLYSGIDFENSTSVNDLLNHAISVPEAFIKLIEPDKAITKFKDNSDIIIQNKDLDPNKNLDLNNTLFNYHHLVNNRPTSVIKLTSNSIYNRVDIKNKGYLKNLRSPPYLSLNTAWPTMSRNNLISNCLFVRSVPCIFTNKFSTTSVCLGKNRRKHFRDIREEYTSVR